MPYYKAPIALRKFKCVHLVNHITMFYGTTMSFQNIITKSVCNIMQTPCQTVYIL